MDDGPDQDPMVPSSRLTMVPGLLSQRRFKLKFEFTVLFKFRSPAVQNLFKFLSVSDKISAASRRLPCLGEISGVIACLPRQESRAQSVSGDTAAVVFISATPIEACTGLQGYLFEKHNSFPDGTKTRTGYFRRGTTGLLEHTYENSIRLRETGGRLAFDRGQLWETDKSCYLYEGKRPDDFPPGEPSEAVIWDAIDRHDPRGDADVRDRLEQHQDMLQGRDVFHSFFARSPLLPECPPESVGFEDPSQWVSSLRLQCGEYHPLESSIAPVSWGTCDILEPAADTVEPVGQSRLLSHRQLQSAPLEWPRDSTVGRVQSPVSGYVHWARYVLQAHRGTLQTAGIYEAVYASLFDYGRLPSSWARGLVEFWDAGRGTCWIGAEEFTVTLSDLQTVSGLPVFGHHFEECVPPDEQLFQRVPSADGDRRGISVLPDVYPIALQHYRHTYRASDLSRRARASMPVEVWVRSFLQEGYLSTVGVSLHDPFGLGLQRGTVLSEETAEPTFTTDSTSPGLPGVGEDLLLVGFLAVWLCTFVLPLRAGSVRCSILLPASQLAQGHRLSLAPATLARIYRSLCTASDATSLELRDLTLPWQYLYGWIHLHVQGAFSVLESPAYFSERGYPTVLPLCQASSTLESGRIRLFFFAPQLVTDRFALVHQTATISLPPHQRGTVVVDGTDRRGRRTLLLRRQSLAVAEYFISMRPGWLCYRSGNTVTLEGYQPNRVAMQFGYS
ncbi:hypothetical protein M5K25_025912 [Dendrobium thyrsiflorum]|uniref:Aminotransferase-like plant mobile domain-containing protein n=1 Tax=Dendrobium thyrsiflorum TaxID=117978 RepID=A0ABD0TW57_DENTH